MIREKNDDELREFVEEAQSKIINVAIGFVEIVRNLDEMIKEELDVQECRTKEECNEK